MTWYATNNNINTPYWQTPMLGYPPMGGFGTSGTTSWSVPMFGGYSGFGGTTPSWGSSNSTGYSSTSTEKANTEPDANASVNFQGLTKQEEGLITDYSTKKQEYVEDLGSTLTFGVGAGIGLANTDKLRHPISAVQCAYKKDSLVNLVFDKKVCEGDLWKNNAGLMQEAYAELYKAEIRSQKRSWQGT